MKNLSDDRLEKLLTDYCEAEPEQSFVFEPTQKQEKIIPFAMYRRWAAAAASLVFVSVLSVTLYFFLGNKINTPIAVAPSPHSATTPSTPEGGSDGVLPTEEQDGIIDDEKPSGIQKLIESIFNKPAETQNAGTTPTSLSLTEKGTESVQNTATENHSPTSAQSATEQPLTKPTENPPQPTVPPQQPTTPPVDPPWIEPSEEIGSDDPDPRDPEAPAPTEGGTMQGNQTYIEVYIPSDLLNDNSVIYCKVYDSSGRRLGSANLYDWTHKAYIEAYFRYEEQYVTLVGYDIPDDVITGEGYYNFVFYNSDGKLLAQVQEYWD